MIRMFVAVLAVLVSVVLVGCGERPVVRELCDQDVSYHILRQQGNPGGYRLYLKVGRVTNPSMFCRGNEWRTRSVNLEAEVKSVEEALQIVERERQTYIDRLERQTTGVTEPPKLPAEKR